MSQTKFIICGASGSGKDTLKRRLCAHEDFEPEVSYTTRDPRGNEKNGRDYHFIEDEEFDRMIEADLFQEWVSFAGNKYGTSWKEWGTKNVFIKTPDSIKEMDTKLRKICFMIYLDIPANIRYLRMKERGMPPEKIEKRLEEDEKLFKGFSYQDLKITNPYF